MKRIDVAIAVVVRNGKVLICQRKDQDTFGGYWEFPGGKAEADESIESCLDREMKEELNLIVRSIAAFPIIEHDYPTVQLRLHPFLCDHLEGEPQLIECQQAIWIDPIQLRDFRFPPANHALLEQIIQKLDAAQRVSTPMTTES
jgi:mutator protein MutT